MKKNKDMLLADKSTTIEIINDLKTRWSRHADPAKTPPHVWRKRYRIF
jgi:hypothetical protein